MNAFGRLSNSATPRASIDNIRLWNVAEVGEFDKKVKSGVQFKIIAGHHGGFVSQMRAYGFGPPRNLFSHPGSQSLTQEPVSSSPRVGTEGGMGSQRERSLYMR